MYRHSIPPISCSATLQPSLAKSKKGLFIALGTNAKTLFSAYEIPEIDIKTNANIATIVFFIFISL